MINVGTPPRLTAAVDWIARADASRVPAVQEARWNSFNSVVIGYRDAATAARAKQLHGDRRRATSRSRPIASSPLLRDVRPAARC